MRFLSIAWRRLRRNRSYLVLNLAGLAGGLFVALLLGAFVVQEASMDRYHAHADRIYRLNQSITFGDRSLDMPSMAPGLAPALVQSVPGVQDAVRFYKEEEFYVRPDEDGASAGLQILNEGAVFADASLFNVFSIEILQRTQRNPLTDPTGTALTQETAHQLFGTMDPLGRRVAMKDGRTFTVTAVVANPPSTSSIRYSMLAPLASLDDVEGGGGEWDALRFPTYVFLAEQADPTEVADAALKIVQARPEQDLAASAERMWAEPLPSVYLHATPDDLSQTGSLTYLVIFGTVALLILLLSVANYVNMFTAQSVERSKEVALRKVLGGHRSEIQRELAMESAFLTGIALLVAGTAAFAAGPALFQALGLSMEWGSLATWRAGRVLALGFAGVAGLAGLFPALVLANASPSTLRSSRGTISGGSGLAVNVRRVLITAQFAISGGLIAATLIVHGQLDFLKTSDLGVQTEGVVVVPLEGTEVQAGAEAFAEALRGLAPVASVSLSDAVPARQYMKSVFVPEGQEAAVVADVFTVDPHFRDIYGVEPVRAEMSESSDGPARVWVNEQFVQDAGWTTPVGERLQRGNASYVVGGVAADFHVASLHEPVGPMVLVEREFPIARYASVRLQGKSVAAALDRMEGVWNDFEANQPFAPFFVDAAFQSMYAAEERMARLFDYFAVFSILVACVGLFGLAAFTVSRREKEVGLRRTLGASTGRIVLLLSREYGLLIGAGLALAVPLTYLGMDRWMDQFAYTLSPSAAPYVLAATAVVACSALAVGYHSVRVARKNPVDVLRG